jgi:excisionase family DNA binding protein
MPQKDCQFEPLLLRGGEVARLVGCSRAMAYRLMQRGTIPVVRIPGGKTIRVPQDSLLEWIKVNTRGGVAEAASSLTDTGAVKPRAKTTNQQASPRKPPERTNSRKTRKGAAGRVDVGR